MVEKLCAGRCEGEVWGEVCGEVLVGKYMRGVGGGVGCV